MTSGFVSPKMILDRLFAYGGELVKHQKIVRAALTVAVLFLTSTKQASPDIISSETAHQFTSSIPLIPAKTGDPFVDNRFELNKLSPRATLHIQGRPEDRKNYYRLISTLQAMDLENMNVIIDLNPVSEDIDYLAEIDLLFGDEACVWVRPFRNHQPNSDFLLVALEFFAAHSWADAADLLFSNSPSNLLEVSLRPSQEDIAVFLGFIKAISFMRSHPYGSYYYIPHHSVRVEAAAFLSSAVCIVAYYVFDWLCALYHVSLARIVLATLLYYLFPITAVFFLRRNEASCLIVIFMVMNFKVGCLYMLLCYLRMVYDMFAMIILPAAAGWLKRLMYRK